MDTSTIIWIIVAIIVVIAIINRVEYGRFD